MKEKRFEKYQIFMVILVTVMGVFSLLAALRTSMGNAPDENMRWPLAQFMSFYMCLPVGNEMEIISKEWGFSYAYTPYFPQIISIISPILSNTYCVCSKSKYSNLLIIINSFLQ